MGIIAMKMAISETIFNRIRDRHRSTVAFVAVIFLLHLECALKF